MERTANEHQVSGNAAAEDESCLIVHEQQSFQLCAIHTINNLLQLTTDNRVGWTCGGTLVIERPSWTLATKTELDSIADELTVAENRLLVEQEDGQHSSPHPSLYEKLSSQHRTIMFGRYSSEVMQMALQRRNVELSWFTPKEQDADCLLCVDNDSDSRVVIGFIVNIISEKSISSRFPILRGWFGDGRHWYAITRLQKRKANENDQVACTNKWKVLDSMYEEPVFVNSDSEILSHLYRIVEDGGNVFRATIPI